MPPDPNADTTTAPGAGDNGAEDQDQDQDHGAERARLDRLEQRVETIADAVNRLLPGSRGEAQQRTEDRLDRPTDVQTAVRAELDRRDRAAAEAAAAETEQNERRSLQEQIARLQEQPPQPPVPRRTRILGWGSDGR